MFTTTIIDDLHVLTNEIQELIDELHDMTREQDIIDRLASHL